MGDKNDLGLRKTLIRLLGDLEQARETCDKASQFSKAIGGSFQKKTASLIKQLDRLAKAALKLEQETREL